MVVFVQEQLITLVSLLYFYESEPLVWACQKCFRDKSAKSYIVFANCLDDSQGDY